MAKKSRSKPTDHSRALFLVLTGIPDIDITMDVKHIASNKKK
jgi:hypothetical protein